jgi:hypothetical protein
VAHFLGGEEARASVVCTRRRQRQGSGLWVIVGIGFERVKHRFCFLVVGEQAPCRKPPTHREGVFPSGEGQGVGQPRPPATHRQQATWPTDKTDPPRRSAEASTVSSAEPLTSRPCGHPSEKGKGLRKTERENPSHPQLKCKLRGLGYDEPSLAICGSDLRG